MRKTSQQIVAVPASGDPSRITQAILDFVSHVPETHIHSSADPAAAAQRLSRRAAQRAALAASSLALPPGPLGWLTLLPELIAIWKIQGQLVSDIAAAYDRHANLGREQMMWCLFRHTAAQAFRDLVVRLGDRLIFRRMSQSVAQRVARQVGVKLTQRTVGKGISRWLPVVGALGVGAYAYYDTIQVAGTAIELFAGETMVEDEVEDGDGDGEDSGTHSDTAATTPDKPVTRANAARHAVAGKVGAAVAGVAHGVAAATRKHAARKTARKPAKKPGAD